MFLDVNFQILDTDAVTFGAQNLLFGRLGLAGLGGTCRWVQVWLGGLGWLGWLAMGWLGWLAGWLAGWLRWLAMGWARAGLQNILVSLLGKVAIAFSQIPHKFHRISTIFIHFTDCFRVSHISIDFHTFT